MVERKKNDKHGKAQWLCKCECGGETIAHTSHLTTGHTKSCGCYNRETASMVNMKHGHSKNKHPSLTYMCWQSMKSRCENVNETGYQNYGGRGIRVCERWHTFENFLEDMGERPKGMFIDRKDNDGDYCKENCKWATRTEQNNNRRNNIIITYNNKKLTLGQWATELGIQYCTLKTRYYKGDRGDKLFREVSNK